MIINLTQGTNEWHLWRSERITASDVSAILGLSKYKTKKELLEEKKTGKSKQIDKFISDRGHQNENIMRGYAEIMLDASLPAMCCTCDEYPTLGASLDGVDETNLIFIEAKYIGAVEFASISTEFDFKAKYESYWWQMQAQYAALGDKAWKGYAALIDSKNNKKLIRVQRDATSRATIIAACTSFVKELAGEITPTTNEVSTEVKVIDNEELLELLEEYKSIQKELLSLEKISNDLKEKIYTHSNSTFACGNYICAYEVRKGNVSYKDIPELKGIDLDLYRGKDISVKRIKFKGEK
jgi:putative phage-type endonuclease